MAAIRFISNHQCQVFLDALFGERKTIKRSEVDADALLQKVMDAAEEHLIPVNEFDDNIELLEMIEDRVMYDHIKDRGYLEEYIPEDFDEFFDDDFMLDKLENEKMIAHLQLEADEDFGDFIRNYFVDWTMEKFLESIDFLE